MARLDLVGQRFGRLVVLRRAGGTQKHPRWRCVCDCGRKTSVQRDNLTNGHTQSRGCLGRDATAKHGASGAAEYMAWYGARDRCLNPNHPQFAGYGGRGITVHPRWDDFTMFLADMGPKPSPKHSLDRIENNGNYEPGNCRWATQLQQANNMRSNVFLTLGDRRLTISQWESEIGLRPGGCVISCVGRRGAGSRPFRWDCW
jgi:hypothetical protein